ncbi:glycine--tRNA ligase subunit beta [Erythrobacteraceae bacterium CFH 75059]|uniref:glycine--tRNA ligase subunit beta n=1 Tax=Qipengyuania thermophila TaxID=2509361 RepID=UPI00102063CB|nr:glycine--tRNA ligase subunit beta [Qipengyuania thermophila]TCD05158.1 glycine--tRNA ligase subunit beta [Erythrobacteraceae bacterium CFH 75059]
MSDFLLELRCEEIPARMQPGAREELERLFRRELHGVGVDAGDVTVLSTPRRLVLIARGLPDATGAVSEEVKGPPEGAPDAALDGFCRKNGVSRDQLQLREVKGRPTWFAVIETPGRAMKAVLAEAVPAMVRDFAWPKSMRWGAASLSTASPRWVRPLSGIVAILGDELVECEAAGVASSCATLGHRFHHSGAITIGGAHDYAEKLRACHVVVDHEERAALIRAGAAKAAADAGLKLVEDEGLVIENAGLTEWPVPLLGRFDAAFLDVPPEVIQLTARVNQKYFVCQDAGGRLANAFVCTANIAAADGGAAIVAGNARVLAARLADARFFWDQDRRKTLAEHAEGLARITFHEKLGTLADKVERVAKLAEWLASDGIVPGCDPALARQAAELCKADLVTDMVGEFPELQGVMGGHYARAEGLPEAVADAIRDHYKPIGQGDEVPTAPVTVAVSLADKLDTLAGFFAANLQPTGSKDPFALRRAALSFLALLTTSQIRVPLRRLLDKAGAGMKQTVLESFLIDRLKVQQREAGVRHDLIDAVFALGNEDDLVRLLARVNALQAFVETADGQNLLAAYKRAANILKKEGWSGARPAKDEPLRTEGIARTGEEDPLALVDDPELAPVVQAQMQAKRAASPSAQREPAEEALVAALDEAEPRAVAAVTAEDFTGAMQALAGLRAPIDAFFEEVTVNDPDQDKRAARLDLLARFRDAVGRVADFSRIEG